MKRLLVSVCVLAAALLWVRLGPSQPPDRGRDAPPPPRGGGDGPPARPRMPTLPIVEALDLDGDGVISEEEMKKAAESLKKLDRNKDGKLTMEEIYLGPRAGGPGRPGGGPGGPGRPGGPGGGGPGGGGPGAGGLPPLPPGMRHPFEPGQVLAPLVRQRLKLTDEQKKEIDNLEKQTKEKVMKILTREQKEQLEEMVRRVPGLPGGREGPGGGPGREGPPPGSGVRPPPPPPPPPPAERPERPPQG